MCMLTFYRPGALPDTWALKNGARYNDDGHGFAIVAGDRLIIRHGLRADDTIAEFDRLRNKYPDGPALFHSRFGTGGTVDMRNCHPFRVGGDRRTVIAHNGIFPAEVQPKKGELRCDTRIAAEDLMYGADLSNPGIREYYTTWMGDNNKVVILSVNADYPESAYILNEAAGHWIEDTWYSNWDHVPYVDRWEAVGTMYSSKRWSKVCPICEQDDEYDEAWNTCLRCNWCLDCMDDLDDCQCALPGGAWYVENAEGTYDRQEHENVEEVRQERMHWWDDAAEKLDDATTRDAVRAVLDEADRREVWDGREVVWDSQTGVYREMYQGDDGPDTRVRPSLLAPDGPPGPR